MLLNYTDMQSVLHYTLIPTKNGNFLICFLQVASDKVFAVISCEYFVSK